MKRPKITDTFEPIPSLNYRYEIDIHGNVRNAKTKRPLKISMKNRRQKCVFLVNSKKVTRSIASLLWEVHGIIPAREKPKATGATIKKDGEAYYFESLSKCRKYLERREHYAPRSLQRRFAQRQAEICGWRIFYREPEQREIPAGSLAYRLN